MSVALLCKEYKKVAVIFKGSVGGGGDVGKYTVNTDALNKK